MSSSKNKKIIFWSSIVGNSLDHYDSALYAFLAPFLAPIFFPESDPVVALILTYGVKSLGVLTRPAGAIFFGNLARSHCIKNLLTYTLIGIAICTMCIGLLPGYIQIGIIAPILLALLRAMQGFFAAGEHSIASLFILDQVSEVTKHGKASSYYLLSTMMGTLLASLAAWLVSISPEPDIYWRLAFILGFLTGLTGLFIRLQTHTGHKLQNDKQKLSSFKVIRVNKWRVLKIIPICGFTYVTYAVPFILLNNIVPLVSDISVDDLLMFNIVLVAFDVILIPIFGHIVIRYDIAKWMATFSSIFAVSIIPIFAILPYLGQIGVTIIKVWIIIIGVAFAAPLNAFLHKISPNKEKYLVSGFGYSLGIELLGKNTTAICLMLLHWSSGLIMPAIYTALVALVATVCLISEIPNNGISRLKSN